MPEPQVDKEEQAPAHRHEDRDANVRAVTYFAIGLVVFVALAVVICGVYYYYLSKNWPHVGIATAPVPDPSQTPPAPQLQTSPQQDLKKMRAYEAARLSSSGWIDQQAGVAHIPIDQAIDLVAQRGLPWKPTQGAGVAPPAPEIGVTISGSGGNAPRTRKP